MSSFDCCTSMQVCLLFTFNFAIWAASLACVGIGIWALVDENFINTIESILGTGEYSVTLQTVQSAAGILIAIGVVTFLVAFCGCCGAIKKNRCMLIVYIGMMIILLLLQITAIVLMFVFNGSIDAMASSIFLSWVQYDVRANTTGITEEQQYATDIVNMNQFTGMCCAVNGPVDYTNSQYQNDTKSQCLVPLTCCTQLEGAQWYAPIPVNTSECCKAQNSAYTYMTGCQIGFYSLIMFPYWVLYVVGFGLLILQILVTIFACVVYRAINDYDDFA